MGGLGKCSVRFLQALGDLFALDMRNKGADHRPIMSFLLKPSTGWKRVIYGFIAKGW